MNENHSPSSNKRHTHLRKQYGPWAVVTGASSGIGREIALELGRAGLNLVLIARNEPSLQQLADEVTSEFRVQASVLPLDLGQAASIDTLVHATRNLEVGLMVAAAGFGTTGPFFSSDLTQELEMLNVNCRALLMLSWHFGRRFAVQGRGGIVLLSSIVGFQGMPNAAHYAATKAYVQALAEAIHVELAPKGVDVLASAPGPTHSGFADRAGMRMGAALSAAEVAQSTLNALGRTPTVLPGLLSKLLTYGPGMLPRMLRVRVMGQVMHGMTKHRLAGDSVNA